MSAQGNDRSSGPKGNEVVRSFVNDPIVRIGGLVLIIAAGCLLYFDPQMGVLPRWRSGPVPADWKRVEVAGSVSMALPPDATFQESPDGVVYANASLFVHILTDIAATPIVRDPATMSDFRATTLTIDNHEARMAMWTDKTPDDFPYNLGVSFDQPKATITFAAATGDGLQAAKTAAHSITFNVPAD